MKSRFLGSTIMFVVLFLMSAMFVSLHSAGLLKEKKGKGEIDWEKGMISAKGTGAVPTGVNATQARPMAIRAATVDSYRNLAEIIYGVRVDSETVVESFVLKSDIIKTKVTGFIQGAMVSEPKYFDDGTVEVVTTVDLNGKSGLGKIMLPVAIENKKNGGTPSNNDKGTLEKILDKIKNLENEIKDLKLRLEKVEQKVMRGFINFLTPKTALAQMSNAASSGDYTGLIIDGMPPSVAPAMSPSVASESGEELYGVLNIDAEIAIEKGVVKYSSSLDSAKKETDRVGNNPMIVQAVDASGSFKANPVLSKDDAQKIKSSNLPKLFPNCSVIIVTQ